MAPLPMSTGQLRRLRWGVRSTLLLGVSASLAANVLHAVDNPISQAIAAWPPLALLLTVELISRVPVHHRSLAVVRLVSTSVIAGIAAWVSYTHMVGVAIAYGESGASPWLLPLSVDGLVVVASICLVELSGRLRDTQPVPVDSPRDQGMSTHANPSVSTPAAASQPKRQAAKPSIPARPDTGGQPRPALVDVSTRDLVIAEHERTPSATNAELAARLGVSTKTIQRHRPDRAVAATVSA